MMKAIMAILAGERAENELRALAQNRKMI